MLPVFERLGEVQASAVTLQKIAAVRKHKWRRQKNNAGVVTVAVPVAFAEPDRQVPGDRPGDRPSDRPGDATDGALALLAAALEVLKGELAIIAHAATERAQAGPQAALQRAQDAEAKLCPAHGREPLASSVPGVEGTSVNPRF